MNILITGSRGFIGKNLSERLKTVRDGKDRTHPELHIEEIFLCSRDTIREKLRDYCRRADFVFHLAGVNRPERPEEFQEGNTGFTDTLLALLRQEENTCPVMFASSVHASLTGRYESSLYGKSKRDAEDLLFRHAKETGAEVYVYRFPNVFGKWCRPDYNSVIATFCHRIARGLPVRIDNADTELELLYIDDLVEEMLTLCAGQIHTKESSGGRTYAVRENFAGHISRCEYDGLRIVPQENGRFCYVKKTHRAKLGEIASMIRTFHSQSETLLVPEQPVDSFEKKLYATWLSYLPEEKIVFPLKMNCDSRGSFTELLKSEKCGQVSVNISRPGITKGQHWHHTKWEFFIVVSGHGLIRERKIGTDEVLEFEVSGEHMEAVHMLPGYTHSIINLSDTEDLVTVMWANELFDPAHPDTFFEEV